MIVIGKTPEPDAAFKILTPWWDVLLRYLTGGIMTIALTTTALQATKDNLVCSPAVDCSLPVSLSPTAPQKHICNKVDYRLSNKTQTVITTMADFRQYSLLDALCFQKGVSQWYPVYFPFILVAEALLLLLIDNFWIMYPRTSSALNHFVTLTMECYACVGTQLDLFRVLSKPKKTTCDEQGSEKEKDVAKTLEVTVEVVDPSAEASESIPLHPPVKEEPGPSQVNVEEDPLEYNFVLSDGMTVKTLFERVQEFNTRFGAGTLLIKVYRVRSLLQILLCLFVLVFHYYNFSLIGDILICKLKVVFVTDYEYFVCARFIAPYYRAVTLIFTAAVLVYFCAIVYAFIWSVRNSIRYDVSTDIKLAGDEVRIKGDLAFLFSLLEQYNKLYCDRLAVFLSEGLKNKLDRKIKKERLKAAEKKQTFKEKGKTSMM